MMIVRIDVSMARETQIVEDVAYYRTKLPMNSVLRWQWYFEYLAARIKVRHPRRRVRLIILQQPDELKVGTDYINKKSQTLLRAKRGQVKKLQSQTSDDLFGFMQCDRNEKIETIQGEIAALERGEFNYWFPVEYRNNIKQWI